MNKNILLAHGSGGKMTQELIRNVFLKRFNNPILNIQSDASLLRINNQLLSFTTDSYVIDPLFFPGGDIGKLAVCGTVNDLSVSGANPLYLSASFIIEEGFPTNQLEKIVDSMQSTANEANITIVTGDTKVVERGQCDKLFINTAGVGSLPEKYKDISTGKAIEIGDKIIVNGFLGDHEMAILSAREKLNFKTAVVSDVAPLNHLIRNVLTTGSIKFMRDITRGGLATILSEITENKHFGIHIQESEIPVREEIKGMCEIFGFDPLFLANEGKVLIIARKENANSILEELHQHPYGKQAKIIGEIVDDHPGKTILESEIGGTRIIDKLSGMQLPRIC